MKKIYYICFIIFSLIILLLGGLNKMFTAQAAAPRGKFGCNILLGDNCNN